MKAYEEACATAAKKLGLPEVLVRKTYQAYWKAIREHIVNLPLKEDLTDEEFLALRPNINIPSIGKFYVTLDRYKRIKRQHKIYIKLKKEKELRNDTHKED